MQKVIFFDFIFFAMICLETYPSLIYSTVDVTFSGSEWTTVYKHFAYVLIEVFKLQKEGVKIWGTNLLDIQDVLHVPRISEHGWISPCHWKAEELNILLDCFASLV